MKLKIFIFFIVSLFLILANCDFANAQQLTGIKGKCASPNQRSFGSVIVGVSGDIFYTPCPTRSSIFTGLVDFSNATVTGLQNGTQFAFPFNNTATTQISSPYSWSTTRYFWNNTALNSPVTMELTPSATGSFKVGDYTTTATSYFTQDYSTNNTVLRATNRVDINSFGVDSISARFDMAIGSFTVQNAAATNLFSLNPAGGDATLTVTDDITVNLGDDFALNATGDMNLSSLVSCFGDCGSSANGTRFVVTDASKRFQPIATGSDGIFTLTTILYYEMFRTNTATGTTGNQTINKPNGSVNIAAAGTSIVITNSTVFTTSNIIAVANTNDATCWVKSAVPTASTITITMNAACTAETRVAFWVYN